MQQAAGEFARDYNRRKHRSGAFWEGRYFATMVDSGDYLWRCLRYVELNMVRCRVVGHPGQWRWSGYGELMGIRTRNTMLDTAKLLWLMGTEDLVSWREQFKRGLEEAIAKGELQRQPPWTEALAVGSQAFVVGAEQKVRNRQQVEVVEEGGAWILREHYGSTFGPKNRAITAF